MFHQGSLFQYEKDIIPPPYPSENYIFPPSHETPFFYTYHAYLP
jgi:hypothetical protein